MFSRKGLAGSGSRRSLKLNEEIIVVHELADQAGEGGVSSAADIFRGAAAEEVRLPDGADVIAVASEYQNVGIGAAVAADPDIAVRGHFDAVVRRRPFVIAVFDRAAPGVDEIAVRVEFENRGGR